ncbi:hypothetical protein CALVIDRAFT_539796 [Calocera viscosa TUFC12733]|uniref:Uncharacterized protein n=1 Tax=Calocera viscosa (strain TUFC12733) TaxID=1330018 RepID=A0A167JIC7_CALVF|nr:hypothetical protein CALVIDRAFT_539796 [Calocera viscosa TUFC12733]
MQLSFVFALALAAAALAYPTQALPEPILRDLQDSLLGERDYWNDVGDLVAKDEAGRDVPAAVPVMREVTAQSWRGRDYEYWEDVPVKKV